jgi:hypothetical protein
VLLRSPPPTKRGLRRIGTGRAGGGGGGGGDAVPRTLSDAPSAPLELGEDIRGFLTSPVPRSAGVVQCYIKREKSGNFFTKMLSSAVFSMMLTGSDRFLLAGTKRTANKTSNYLVSMDKRDLARDSAAFLGKVRANFLGTEYQMYDDGESPESRSGELRQELGVLCFAPNVMGSRGPRKMRVAVPKVTADGRATVFRPGKDDDSMLKKFAAMHTADLFTLINKPPKWNDQVGAYVLNFGGRVTQASVKNFQLVQPEDMDAVVLQFGRVEKDTFNMDFQWPLSPLQAFSICLAAFVRGPYAPRFTLPAQLRFGGAPSHKLHTHTRALARRNASPHANRRTISCLSSKRGVEKREEKPKTAPYFSSAQAPYL